ncbi:MAG: winged helix-turn-helix transcriptional regulator [Candidatus Margulisbacteria bacterium]|nr:winged helix-turn-helix transcriptional regulator [Candidatus Margulisiibacteriota bacterium]
MVNENELKIIDEISRESSLTQRELSQKTNLSLGAVNIILKRLVKRGAIKTKNLNPKKVEYMITPIGFSEKAKKSYNYFLKTVNLVKFVKLEIAKIVLEEFNRGQKKFVILGDDDLVDIIELALKGFDYERVESINQKKDKNVLILLGEKRYRTNGFRVINIADRLKEVYWGTDYDREAALR